MTKKIFAISTLVLILLVGVIFVYNFTFKKSAPSENNPAAETVGEGKTNSTASPKEQTATKKSNEVITAISDGPVFGAVLAPDQKFIYYFAGENGQLNEVDFDGKLEKVIFTEEFRNIKKIIWNKQKNKVIIRREDIPGRSKFLLFDLTQKNVAPLSDSIGFIIWNGLGDKIVYTYNDPKTKKDTLNIAEPNGINWRKISDINFSSATISAVPGSSDISFWPNPNAFVSSPAVSVSSDGETRKEILKDRLGADLLWSPDGKYAAVSYTDQKGGKKTDLALMNADGGQFHSLSFPTFAKKCAWSADSKFLYCAMPGNIPPEAILPNNWQEGKTRTADTFWKIEIATGKKDRLIEADKIGGSYDALNPFLSSDEKTLFFLNKADGKLYKLEL